MKHLTKSILLIAGLAALPLAAAQDESPGFAPEFPPDHRSEHRPGDPHGDVLRRIGHAMRQLDLDEAQRARIRELMWNSRDELHANMLATATGRDQLRDIVMADELDQAALAGAAAEAGRLAEERILITANTVHAVLAELDESQRARLMEMRAKHRARRSAGPPTE